MKKIYAIGFIFISLIIIISGFFIFKSLDNRSSKSREIFHIDNLDVLSQYNGYVLARESEYSELEIYSIYKNVEYNNYQKQFTFKDGIVIESRMVYWTSNKIYVLGYNPASYSLSDGHVIDKGSLKSMVNNSTGLIDGIIGMYDDFIYYTYTYQGKSFYGKVTLDLKEYIIIEKADIPNELHY